MIGSPPKFEYPTSLQEYAVNAAEFLRQRSQYDVLCTGIVVFNKNGKLLLVQRAADEKAFPDMWEVPGGKVDDTDDTLLHAAVRELKEETGLVATRVCGKAAELTFGDGRPGRRRVTWLKLIFHMEVEKMEVILDPVEHQRYLFVTKEEIDHNLVGDVRLTYISEENKRIKLDAFSLLEEASPS